MKKRKPEEDMGKKSSVWPIMNNTAVVATVLGTIIIVLSFPAYTAVQFGEIENRFDRIEARFDKIDATLNKIDERMDSFEENSTQINSLLNADMTWRYLYQYDPHLKRMIPIYDPVKRSLEFRQP